MIQPLTTIEPAGKSLVSIPDGVVKAAHNLLTLPNAVGGMDTWLLEHSERVMRLAHLLAQLPELRADPPDPTALAAAALFHDAGLALQIRDGLIPLSQLMSRPTSDAQRDLGANELTDRCSTFLSAETLGLACEAIRQCNNRNATQPEAQVLADAENIDEIGIIFVLRQFRQHQAEGRPLQQLVQNWMRQRQYRYWEARIERLRFKISRQLAQQRLTEIEHWMKLLEVEAEAADLRDLLAGMGLTLTPPPG